MFLIAQMVSVVTIFTTVIALFCKNKYNSMLFMTLANISMIVTYVLLERYLGCLLVGGATLRTFIYFVYAKFNKKPQLIFVIFFEFYFIILSMFLWKDFSDLFMLANLCLLTYTTWQDNMSVFRIGYIFSSLFLITYDIYVRAYVGSISEIIMLVVSVMTLVKYNFLNKVDDIVEHFYTTIAPANDIQIEKKGNLEYVISSFIKDEFNNFCYIKSPEQVEVNLDAINGKFALAKRKPTVYIQSVDNENINEIMKFSKTHKLLFHDCWMKLRTGYSNKTKKCLLDEVVFRAADEKNKDELLYVFSRGFIECGENEVYKYSKEYYDKYKKIFENNELKKYNISPFVAYYNNQPISVLFVYSNGTNAYICQITTLEEYRRKGVASGLINFSIQSMRKRGIEDFYLVTEKYTFLETFYLKNNFEEISQGFCFDLGHQSGQIESAS